MPFICFCQSVWNSKLCLEIKQDSLTNVVETSEMNLLYRAWSAAYCTCLSITYHPPLDRVPCLCSSMCHISFPPCWAQSCATVLKLHLDICQNAVFQVTLQLFSSSCTDVLPCCLQYPHMAGPVLLISPCCYRIWFSICPCCVFKEVFSVCSGGGVPKTWCSGLQLLYNFSFSYAASVPLCEL